MTTIPRYSVDLCDASWAKLGESSGFRFDGTQSYNAAGSWTLSAARTSLEIASADLDLVRSVIVWENRTRRRIVFAGRTQKNPSGPLAGRRRRLTAQGTEMTFMGVDLFGVLNGRSAWPSPSAQPPWSVAHHEVSGQGSTVAATFLSANFGPDARSDRRVANVTINDSQVGEAGTWSARAGLLGDFVGQVCRESGVGCHASMPTPGLYQFDFDSPNDLSNSLIFTDQGDLELLSQLVVPASATYVIAAGAGDLEDREFAFADSGATGEERVEMIHEARNTTSLPALQRTAATQLALGAEDVSVEAILSPQAAQRIAFGDDYVLGDFLGVEVDGDRYSSQVESVRFTINPDRSLVVPVLGRAPAGEASALFSQVGDLASRFNTQIR